MPPLTLNDIAPGLPNTWTACPKGLELPDGTFSTGKFDMIYQYERPTGFTPVRDCAPVSRVDECQPYEGPVEDVFFPEMTLAEVQERAQLIWNQNIMHLGAA